MIDFENKKYCESVINTVKELLIAQNKNDIATLLNNAEISILQTDYDNWNSNIHYYYTMYVNVNTFEFTKLETKAIEEDIRNALNTATRYTDSITFSVIISPKSNYSSKQELLKHIDYLKNTMISVSTGGQRIQSVDEQYKQIYNEVNQQLKKLYIENPNNYNSLWAWYNKWHHELDSYQERRNYINEMYKQLINNLSETDNTKIVDVKIDLSGWDKIKRSIIEIKKREQQAQNEEQFQAIGMLCRELIITLAQTVYDSEKHSSADGIEISKTDAKRMLESYIAVVLSGSESEELRVYAKATNKLANVLTHKRTATKKEMMLCTSATLALINFIGILENKI
jgi:vacuolar-type H+-ATPase subunit I/STV1